jgi:hypothetical protein
MIRRMSSLKLSCAGLVVTVVGFGAAAHAAAPELPAPLRVPAGAKLVAQFHATGAQVYGCAASAPGAPGASGSFAWTLKRPDATLFDAAGAPAGTHTAGPTWTAKDGSAVVGEKVAQADAPAPDAVPWLLLRAKSSSGSGQLSQVTFIQRVQTKGGKAPAVGCDAGKAGAETRAPYSADYLFYAGGAPAKTKP